MIDRDLHFHHVHGRNARVSNGGRTASRPRALGEFNDSIVMSNRPLNEDEMFAVVVEKIVDRWSGSIEAGGYLFININYTHSKCIFYCILLTNLLKELLR